MHQSRDDDGLVRAKAKGVIHATRDRGTDFLRGRLNEDRKSQIAVAGGDNVSLAMVSP
jgi:hypothetical protein